MEKLDFDFWIIASYIVPGLLSLYAVSIYIPYIHLLFKIVTFPNLTMLILWSIATGFITNAISFVCFRIFFRFMHNMPTEDEYAKLSIEKLEVIKYTILNNFKYMEIYTNLATSLIIIILMLTLKNGFEYIFTIVIAISAILLYSGYYTHTRYVKRLNALLKIQCLKAESYSQ